jgi:UDP-N-acetylglucosamine--N-acetylmuramyl-(pentapeptide) pyrophosphoryl-undecaprenol N-acetylglucosamine transferase
VIVVTGGGTGGHIFPCIAVIAELRQRGYRDFAWIGERRGKEREWAQKIGVPFHGIRTGKLRRYFSLKNASDAVIVLIGLLQSFFLLLRLKPEVLFSKGGFVSVPPVLAGWILRIPVVTHESDIIPGLATRIISRFASAVCVSFERTLQHFPGRRAFFTGNPVREIIKKGSKRSGYEFLHHDDGPPVVFVVGGSSGAATINTAVWRMKERCMHLFFLVHQCGQGNLRSDLPPELHYRQYGFIGAEIGDVIAASDLVVSRAGGGALYELGFLKKPSILIPLPRSASRGEQIANARYFEENGAARVIRNEDLNEQVLYDAIDLLLSDPEQLKRMGQRAHSLCKKDAEKEISDVIESVRTCKRELDRSRNT